MRFEVPDGRAGEKPDTRLSPNARRQLEQLREIRNNRQHLEVGKISLHIRRVGANILFADIDRHVSRERRGRLQQ
jgi:hypothetical protein